jgi:hypothetical protein
VQSGFVEEIRAFICLVSLFCYFVSYEVSFRYYVGWFVVIGEFVIYASFSMVVVMTFPIYERQEKMKEHCIKRGRKRTFVR